MEVTASRVHALLKPLRTIALDGTGRQQELRGQLHHLASDIRALGRTDLLRWVERAETAPDGYADEPLTELADILTAEERGQTS